MGRTRVHAQIMRAIDAGLTLRIKKDLIEDFVDSVAVGIRGCSVL